MRIRYHGQSRRAPLAVPKAALQAARSAAALLESAPVPELSIIIPAYNEQSRLPGSLRQIVEFLRGERWAGIEILVVNDGSSDQTAEVGHSLAGELAGDGITIAVVDNPGNRGKGYAIRNGMLRASGDWLLFTDADLSAPIEELPKLWDAVQGGAADVAIGSRALDRSLIGVHQSAFREFAGRIFNFIVRVVAGLPFQDTQCGFKIFSKAAAAKIFPRQLLERFGFDVEVLFLARRLGCRVREVPVRWDHCEGTKVSAFGGADAFLDILRVRWNTLRGRYRDTGHR